MKFELKPFQEKAVKGLLRYARTSKRDYEDEETGEKTPQIISFTAPTGAGKTIMLAAFVEKIYEKNPDAIFVWLSDSPELNTQSQDKFYFNADGINSSQLVTIDSENFNQRILDDGKIYFLNTQKLSKTSNLTRQSDSRQYTIWETLQHTISEKFDKLYFIIDEAHRGMKTSRASATATTIMQKFIKGSEEDNLSPAPLIIGMSATPERFNALVAGASLSTHYVIVKPEEVKQSGLLKERIIVVYPETDEEKAKSIISRDMSMLDAAADEWKNKCEHWAQYCHERHKKFFNPIFVIQVLNGTSKKISETDLNECLRRISARTGYKFEVGEVVHTFGKTESDLTINNLRVIYEEPSRISGNDRIKIVFFKENLSTGWDCPQAETMMSFRRATDSTYIAQLLGRMIRTPMQSRIAVDETLNEVRLYLPNFDEETVKDVVGKLEENEGDVISAEIIPESIGEKKFDVLTVKVEKHVEKLPPKVEPSARENFYNDEADKSEVDSQKKFEENFSKPTEKIPPATEKISMPAIEGVPTKKIIPAQFVQSETVAEKFFDREEIVKAINQMGLLTYTVRRVQINDYLKSLLKLAHFLSRNGIYPDAFNDVREKIIEFIHDYIEGLKTSGKYEELKKKVKQFRLSEKTFDIYGRPVESVASQNLFVTTDADIERQFFQAELKLKSDGVAEAYVKKFCDDYEKIDDYRVDVIIFVANVNYLNELEKFAQKNFYGLTDEYRLKLVKCSKEVMDEYAKIVADSDAVTEQNFILPETVIIPHDDGGKEYIDHLFADKRTGTARIKLNGWEEGILHEEQRQKNFVCWLRNSQRASWAMCIPYKSEDNETHALYPDFLIVRQTEDGYIVDILEPHDSKRRDNFGKARGLAEYAKKNNGIGRIQLIREVSKAGQKYFSRLDISKAEVQNKILHAASNNELDKIFDEFGNHI